MMKKIDKGKSFLNDNYGVRFSTNIYRKCRQSICKKIQVKYCNFQPLFQKIAGAQMSSVDMSLQNVLTTQRIVFNVAQNTIGAMGGNFCGRFIKIQHGINYRAYPSFHVCHDIGKCRCGVVEEGCHCRLLVGRHC